MSAHHEILAVDVLLRLGRTPGAFQTWRRLSIEPMVCFENDALGFGSLVISDYCWQGPAGQGRTDRERIILVGCREHAGRLVSLVYPASGRWVALVPCCPMVEVQNGGRGAGGGRESGGDVDVEQERERCRSERK